MSTEKMALAISMTKRQEQTSLGSSSASSVDSVRATGGRSLALKHEVQLRELIAAGKRSEESNTDDMLPLMGPYRKLLALVRQQLEECIYSDEYTSTEESPFFKRIPYCVLDERNHIQRKQKEESLIDQHNVLVERYDNLKKTLEERGDQINTLERQLLHSNKTISFLRDELRKSKINIGNLNSDLSTERNEQAVVEDELQDSITDLESKLDTKTSEASHLRQYKEGYDNLHKSFEKKLDLKEMEMKQKTVLGAELDIAKSMEKQLLMLQSAQITEYEKYLEMNDLAVSTSGEIGGDAIQHVESHDELVHRQNQFKEDIELLAHETGLLAAHVSQIEAQILHEESRFQAHRQGRKNWRTQIPSKYSIMLSTSINRGKNYTAIKESSHCMQCGERTVTCPHKTIHDQEIQLPRNVTHLKITHPRLRMLKPELVRSDDSVLAGHTHQESGGTGDDVRVSNKNVPVVSLTSGILYETDNTTRLTSKFPQLWEYYDSCFGNFRRPFMRILSEEFIVDLVRSVYHGMPQVTGHFADSNNQSIQSFEKFFYSFLHERYMIPEIEHMLSHDILASIDRYADNNSFIRMFALQMSGELDPSTWRYVLQIEDLMERFPDARSPQTYRYFIGLLYESTTQEIVERFNLEFTAWSENHVSHDIFFEYIVSLINRGHEPRVIYLEKALTKYEVLGRGYLSIDEFCEALDLLNYTEVTETLKRRLYKESQEMLEPDQQVSVRSLAQITAYFDIMKITRKVNLHPEILESIPVRNASKVSMRKTSTVTYPESADSASLNISYRGSSVLRRSNKTINAPPLIEASTSSMASAPRVPSRRTSVARASAIRTRKLNQARPSPGMSQGTGFMLVPTIRSVNVVERPPTSLIEQEYDNDENMF